MISIRIRELRQNRVGYRCYAASYMGLLLTQTSSLRRIPLCIATNARVSSAMVRVKCAKAAALGASPFVYKAMIPSLQLHISIQPSIPSIILYIFIYVSLATGKHSTMVLYSRIVALAAPTAYLLTSASVSAAPFEDNFRRGPLDQGPNIKRQYQNGTNATLAIRQGK